MGMIFWWKNELFRKINPNFISGGINEDGTMQDHVAVKNVNIRIGNRRGGKTVSVFDDSR